MKHISASLIALSFVFPLLAANAQEQSLMERGAQMFLEGLMQEVEPALDDLSALADDMGPAVRDFAGKMGPAFRDLMGQVEDWSVYEAPEILPNGDIIIRRKPEPDSPPAPQIDL